MADAKPYRDVFTGVFWKALPYRVVLPKSGRLIRSKALRKIRQLRHLAGSEARPHGVQGHIDTFFRCLGSTSDGNGRASDQGN